MRSLSTLEIIAVWERGSQQHPVDRALTLLEACCAEDRESLARASIGRRDELLLLVHKQLFGEALQAFAECPQCGQHLEYTLSTREVATGSSVPADDAALRLVEDETQWQLRLPNSFDLGAVASCPDMPSARRLLAERCIVEVTRAGNHVVMPELTDSTVELISARLSGADPQAEILIDLNCAACRHAWQVILEIESFLWTRISTLAKRLLRDVHTLAQVYGWTEHEILSLSPQRRQVYLEMVG